MDDYDHFVRRVYRQTGINLHDYKEAQMKRRLTAFLLREGFHSFQQLSKALDGDLSLMERFLNRITINVSEFFRNPERWRELQVNVLPALLKAHQSIKCWSAACSSGEEPYSLAMVLKQFKPCPSFELWATDIDEEVLKRAQEGVYHNQSLRNVSPENIKKFFRPLDESHYQIEEKLRRCVRFARHNLLSEQYPDDCQLIVCRNVMIYFTEEAKDRIYRRLSGSLSPGGVLFVGSTEQILRPADYGLVAVAPFFYQRVAKR